MAEAWQNHARLNGNDDRNVYRDTAQFIGTEEDADGCVTHKLEGQRRELSTSGKKTGNKDTGEQVPEERMRARMPSVRVIQNARRWVVDEKEDDKTERHGCEVAGSAGWPDRRRKEDEPYRQKLEHEAEHAVPDLLEKNRCDMAWYMGENRPSG